MSTLRERLEAKERRRLVVPIQVSDPATDHEAWMGIYAAIEVAKGRQDDEAVADLRMQLEGVGERVRSHWVSVELQAMSSRDWEAASQVWASADDTGDGGIDWSRALAPLLAESCTDPELAEVDWWQGQLSRDNWSEGDCEVLRLALLRLNVSALEPHVPKD